MPAKNVTLTANWTYNGGSTGGGSSYSYYQIKITKEGKGTISTDGGLNNTVTIGEMTE
ncbi:MAG: hypothetical protein VB018_05085 [Lachnospiraceae bacterium]|nr:hypothetical protein [Lachnospiraceae bacterium]